MDTEFPSRRKIMEISGGEGSTESPPGMENPGDGDQTGKNLQGGYGHFLEPHISIQRMC